VIFQQRPLNYLSLARIGTLTGIIVLYIINVLIALFLPKFISFPFLIFKEYQGSNLMTCLNALDLAVNCQPKKWDAD